MSESILDKYCQDIFFFLLLNDKPIRFNDMDKKINKPSPRMTRPTLLHHLDHLLALKLIIKKKRGSQNVTYEVNYQKTQETFKQSPISRRILVNTLDNQRRFASLGPDGQTALGTVVLTLGGLQQLKLEILNILNPKDGFENTLQLLLTQRFYDLFTKWLLQNCTESTEHAHQVLNELERSIEGLTKEFFVKIPKAS